MLTGILSYLASAASPTPTPTPMELNEQNVNPGPMAAVLFSALAISLVVLLFSMNRHLKRVNFNENNDSK